MKLPIFKCKLEGFSLIEISMVLIIIGVMMGSVLKGRDLLEQAKARAVVSDFSRIQTALLLYSHEYDSHIFNSNLEVWKKLAMAELLPSDQPPTSKLGGVFSLVKEDDSYYLKLGKGENSSDAFLTYSQIMAIVARLKEDNPQSIVIYNKSGTKITSLEDKADKKELYSLALVLQK